MSIPPDTPSYRRFEEEICQFLRNIRRPPASMESIANLNGVPVKQEDIKEGGACCICMEDWKVDDIATETPCEHRFHWPCIYKWLTECGFCPVCRHCMPVDHRYLCMLIHGYAGGFTGNEEGDQEMRESWRNENMTHNLRRFLILSSVFEDPLEYFNDQPSTSGND